MAISFFFSFCSADFNCDLLEQMFAEEMEQQHKSETKF